MRDGDRKKEGREAEMVKTNRPPTVTPEGEQQCTLRTPWLLAGMSSTRASACRPRSHTYTFLAVRDTWRAYVIKKIGTPRGGGERERQEVIF